MGDIGENGNIELNSSYTVLSETMGSDLENAVRQFSVDHLPEIHVPCLFISGTRDPFGTPDELAEWTSTIPGRVEHVWIEGGRHDLRGADEQIVAATDTFLSSVMDR